MLTLRPRVAKAAPTPAPATAPIAAPPTLVSPTGGASAPLAVTFKWNHVINPQDSGYQLQVTATRDDEINGRAIVNVLLQPTFSIDFVAVTLVLQ